MNRKIFFFILIFFGSFAFSLENEDNSFENIKQEFQDSNWDIVLQKTSDFLTHYPYSKYTDDIVFLRGQSYIKLNSYQNAEIEFKKMKNHSEVLFWQGKTEYLRLNFEKSILFYKESLKKAGIETNLGKNALLEMISVMIESNIEKYDSEIESVLSFLLTESDEFQRKATILKIKYLSLKNDAETLKRFARQLDKNIFTKKELAEIYLSQAYTYKMTNDLNNAEQFYFCALDETSSFGQKIALKSLFDLYLLQNNLSKASKLLDDYTIFDENLLSTFYYQLGTAYLHQNNLEKSNFFFAQITKKDLFTDELDLLDAKIAFKSDNENSKKATYEKLKKDFEKNTFSKEALYYLIKYSFDEKLYSDLFTFCDVFESRFSHADDAKMLPLVLERHTNCLFNLKKYDDVIDIVSKFENRDLTYMTILLYAQSLQLKKQSEQACEILSAYFYKDRFPDFRLYDDLTFPIENVFNYACQFFVNDNIFDDDLFYSAKRNFYLAISEMKKEHWSQSELLLDGIQENVLENISPFLIFFKGYCQYKQNEFLAMGNSFENLIKKYPSSLLSSEISLAAAKIFMSLNIDNQRNNLFYDRYVSLFYSFASEKNKARKNLSVFTFNLANYYAKTKKYDNAINEIDKNIDKYDSSLKEKSLVLKGFCKFKQKKYDEAVNIEKENLEIFQSRLSKEFSTFSLAKYYYAKKDIEKTKEIFAIYKKNYPDGLFVDGVYYFDAEIDISSAQYKTAMSSLENLVKNCPQSPYTEKSYICMMNIYRKIGNYNLALSNAETLMSKYEGSSIAMQAEIQAEELTLMINGMDETVAVSTVKYNRSGKKATKAGRENGLELAKVYLSKERYKNEAPPLLESLLTECEKNLQQDKKLATDIAFLLGDCYVEDKNFDDGVPYILKAAEYSASYDGDKTCKILYHVVEILYSLKDSLDAKETLKTMKKLWPDSDWTKKAEKMLEPSAGQNTIKL